MGNSDSKEQSFETDPGSIERAFPFCFGGRDKAEMDKTEKVFAPECIGKAEKKKSKEVMFADELREEKKKKKMRPNFGPTKSIKASIAVLENEGRLKGDSLSEEALEHISSLEDLLDRGDISLDEYTRKLSETSTPF